MPLSPLVPFVVLSAILATPSIKTESLNALYQNQGIQTPSILPPFSGTQRQHEFAPPFMLSVSAYTSRISETDETPCLASRNFDLCEAVARGEYRDIEYKGKSSLPFLCASNDYPLGTMVLIEGFGECEIRDRMNKRYTGKGFLDIYFGKGKSSLRLAREFGRQNLKVLIKFSPEN